MCNTQTPRIHSVLRKSAEAGVANDFETSFNAPILKQAGQ